MSENLVHGLITRLLKKEKERPDIRSIKETILHKTIKKKIEGK